MGAINTPEPMGGRGQGPNGTDGFKRADKRLNEIYAKLLAKTEPAKRERFREEQRAWLMSRDTDAQVAAIQAWSSGRESLARILESKALATEARVAELEKR